MPHLLSYLLFRYIPPALTYNPNTGDRNANIMWIIVAALVVSAVLIVVLAVTSKNKKKPRK